jgi:hypothetical protein
MQRRSNADGVAPRAAKGIQQSAVSYESNAQNEEVPSATINAEYGMHDAKR